jgi:hypothetical protein
VETKARSPKATGKLSGKKAEAKATAKAPPEKVRREVDIATPEEDRKRVGRKPVAAYS